MTVGTIYYLSERQRRMKDNEYDDIPVYYCKHCLSLLIKADEFVGDFCADCGSTDIGETLIEDWEKLYFKKYKKKF